MKSLELRQKFFDFFIKNGHEKVASSSLIPAQDPTILFTNAGMNQFKDLFLGLEKRSYKRAVTIQKCMRAGGKHNDLDNVGFTKRHLTFFEMMGNFSFGDYFKKEAIRYAWDFLTKDIKLNADLLHATVFENDDESYDIWHKEIGLPKEKISKLGAQDNFWQMGDTGPCGPCTEIYYDRGPSQGCGQKNCAPGCSCDRFMEIWNNVFMQFNRQQDGTLLPLKQTGVDTGMGLERLCMVMQNKDSVYMTDLFDNILKKIEELTGVEYSKQDDRIKAAFHVLADHIRACSFLIADGCSPSNDGRGYVLRKIIRRAALFEQKLTNKSIFPELADTVISTMSPIYPELKVNSQIIKSILESEIEKFAHNLIRGNNILEKYFQDTLDTKIITGIQAFKLYDTFGFPVEIVEAAAKERGYAVDIISFELEMNKQKESSGKKADTTSDIELPENLITEFVGYNNLNNESEIIAIIQNNKLVDSAEQNTECWVITKQTPFFVETGGQVNDKGTVEINPLRPTQGERNVEILNLKKFNKAIGIKINAPVKLKVGDIVNAKVENEHRINTMKNHTATHLLQAALIELLGKQIKQSGSIVTPDYLRFDFTYHKNLTNEEITLVENIVNQKIRDNIAVDVFQTTYKDAVNKGVIAIFGEKYNPEKVRVVDIPGFSAELCGGTHVHRTGDIGAFKITEVAALSAGNRRIVALTGPKAVDLFQFTFNTMKTLSQEYKIKPEQILEVINKQKDEVRSLQLKIKQLKKENIAEKLPAWLNNMENIKNLPFLFKELSGYDNSELKEIALDLKNKKPGAYFLINKTTDSTSFIFIISPEFTANFNLKEFSNWLKMECKLNGGLKENIIQGGGLPNNNELESKIKSWIIQQYINQ